MVAPKHPKKYKGGREAYWRSGDGEDAACDVDFQWQKGVQRLPKLSDQMRQRGVWEKEDKSLDGGDLTSATRQSLEMGKRAVEARFWSYGRRCGGRFKERARKR